MTIVQQAAVRAAAHTDLAAVERLLAASGLPLDGVSEALPWFVIAEADNDIVGVAGLEPCGEYALLRSAAVAESWRSRGVGRALVERVLADADARGIPALYLLTTTAETWFPAFGFQVVSRDEVPAEVRGTAEFGSACPASATVMRRRASHRRVTGR